MEKLEDNIWKDWLIEEILLIDEKMTSEELEELDNKSLEKLHEFNLMTSEEKEDNLKESENELKESDSEIEELEEQISKLDNTNSSKLDMEEDKEEILKRKLKFIKEGKPVINLLRGNIGNVISINKEDSTALISFVNKKTGKSAEIPISLYDLTTESEKEYLENLKPNKELNFTDKSEYNFDSINSNNTDFNSYINDRTSKISESKQSIEQKINDRTLQSNQEGFEENEVWVKEGLQLEKDLNKLESDSKFIEELKVKQEKYLEDTQLKEKLIKEVKDLEKEIKFLSDSEEDNQKKIDEKETLLYSKKKDIKNLNKQISKFEDKLIEDKINNYGIEEVINTFLSQEKVLSLIKRKQKFHVFSDLDTKLLKEIDKKYKKIDKNKVDKIDSKKSKKIEFLFKTINRIEKLSEKKFYHKSKDLNKLSNEELNDLEEKLNLFKLELEEKSKKKWESITIEGKKGDLIKKIFILEDSIINKSGDSRRKKLTKEELQELNEEKLENIHKKLQEESFQLERDNQKNKMLKQKENMILNLLDNYKKITEMGIKIKDTTPNQTLFTKKHLSGLKFDKLEKIDKKLKDKLKLELENKKKEKEELNRKDKLIIIHKLRRTIALKGGKVEKEIIKDLSNKSNEELDVVISKLQKIESGLPKINATQERANKTLRKGSDKIKNVGKDLTNQLSQVGQGIIQNIDSIDSNMSL